MTIQERLKDTETALHIAQVERDKWKARAIKLTKILGIRDCDIDDFDLNNATNGDMIKALFPNAIYTHIKHISGINFTRVRGLNVFGLAQDFYDDWWNAPYKKEGDGE